MLQMCTEDLQLTYIPQNVGSIYSIQIYVYVKNVHFVTRIQYQNMNSTDMYSSNQIQIYIYCKYQKIHILLVLHISSQQLGYIYYASWKVSVDPLSW